MKLNTVLLVKRLNFYLYFGKINIVVLIAQNLNKKLPGTVEALKKD